MNKKARLFQVLDTFNLFRRPKKAEETGRVVLLILYLAVAAAAIAGFYLIFKKLG